MSFMSCEQITLRLIVRWLVLSGTDRSEFMQKFTFQSFLFHLENIFLFSLFPILTINYNNAAMSREETLAFEIDHCEPSNVHAIYDSWKPQQAHRQLFAPLARRRVQCERKEKVYCIIYPERRRRRRKNEKKKKNCARWRFNWANFSRVFAARHKRKKKDFFFLHHVRDLSHESELRIRMSLVG